MRFAFKTSPQNTTWSDMLAVWREAEDIEIYESGWLFDHFYPIWSPQKAADPRDPCLEGWTALTALAQATQRLRLGILVTGVHYRHPAVLANMAATIDVISAGRLELGVGAGWNEQESGAYGIPLGTPRERSDRFEEACQVLIGLLSQESTDFNGSYYQLTDARCEPKGPQRPHPPIVVGGNGEHRTLLTAAKYAQHWNFLGGPVEDFVRKRDVLFRHCGDVGRDREEITLSSHIWLGSKDDIGRAVDDVAKFQAAGLDLAIIYLQPPLNPAVLAPLAEALAALG